MNLFSVESLNTLWKKMRTHPITRDKKELPVGVDGMSCESFEKHITNNLTEISRKILISNDSRCNYHFAPLLRIEKNKFSGGVRYLHIPRLRDQIVMRAMHDDITRSASLDNISLSSPTPSGIIKLFYKSLEKFKDPIVIRTDIKQFYDSIPREKVVEKVMSLKINMHTRNLLNNWNKELIARLPWHSGTNSDIPIEGLPQGLSISSSLSELWAKDLDKFLHEYCFFRYADDIAIICESFNEAEHMLSLLQTEIKQLDLRLSPNKTHISQLEDGVKWLGLTHYKDRITIEDEKIDRWFKKFVRMKKETAQRLANIKLQNENASIVKEFLNDVSNEINGKTSTRIKWYAIADNCEIWRAFDKRLHALIRSVLRQAKQKDNMQLPSVYRKIKSIKKQDCLNAD